MSGAGDGYETAHAHAVAGRAAEAETLCHKILAADPTDDRALHLLGGIALRRGQVATAEELVRKAIQLSPGNPEYHDNLGALLLDRGKEDEAIAEFRSAIALDPDFVMAHNNLGNALKQKGDFEGGAAAFRHALELNPDIAEIHSNLGTAYRGLGMLDQALACHRQALAIDPDNSGVLNNLGNVLKKMKLLDEAAASYRRALLIKPDFAAALTHLGDVLRLQEKLEEAEECMHRAIALAPDFATAHSKLGVVFKSLGRYREAETCFRRAIGINSDSAPAHGYLGILLDSLGRYDEAEESFRQAVRISPRDPMANVRLALFLLALGDFARAWPHYALRPSVRHRRQALWQEPLPDDLDGKRVFLHTDQGLGDDIFFLRFAPGLKNRGAWICHDPGPKIASIVARFPFIDKIVGDGETPQGVDITLSAGDLPLALDMKSIADIPPPVALEPEPGRVEAVRARLESWGPRPYIGITWRAGTKDKPESLFKEAPLDGVGGALQQAGGTVAVLQRNPEPGEIDALSRDLGREAHDFTALNDDLEEMLALLSLLDEYITVSNTNVHLRTGAGRTSRVLVPNPPDYRWMVEGDESPWFPGCTVYRQTAEGDWDRALAALAADLAKAFVP